MAEKTYGSPAKQMVGVETSWNEFPTGCQIWLLFEGLQGQKRTPLDPIATQVIHLLVAGSFSNPFSRTSCCFVLLVTQILKTTKRVSAVNSTWTGHTVSVPVRSDTARVIVASTITRDIMTVHQKDGRDGALFNCRICGLYCLGVQQGRMRISKRIGYKEGCHH